MIYRSDRSSDIRQLGPSQRIQEACHGEYLATCRRSGWRVYFGNVVGSEFEIYRSHRFKLTHKMVDRMEQAIAIDRLYRGPV